MTIRCRASGTGNLKLILLIIGTIDKKGDFDVRFVFRDLAGIIDISRHIEYVDTGNVANRS